ncbi:MAG: PGN_0703 family putative restriction endonuclease [Blastomonas sp.]
MNQNAKSRCTFARDEQAIQIAYYSQHFADRSGHRGRAFQLQADHRLSGLMGNELELEPLFAAKKIQWHTYIGHGRSSQACCINFLAPMGKRPEILSQWVGSVLGIAPPKMLPVETGVDGEDWFVAFEYTGPCDIDYLGEAGGKTPQRGANATAADAAVAFERGDGSREVILIEWKYTEEYRNHRLSEDRRETRVGRYAAIAFAPDGPIRNDLGLKLQDFFHEPLYQLLRQQMLAFQIERNPESGFDRARVLHLSPSANRALHHLTAPALKSLAGVEYDDAFCAYRATLVDPEAFMERSIETAFEPVTNMADAGWIGPLRERYPTLFSQSDA